MKITRIEPVLLTSPYADPTDSEVLAHLPHGMRNCGLVEIELENGITGIGEGYMAVFAPDVFVAFVELYSQHLVGTDGFNISARYRQCCRISDYFSLRGAARHAISAIETALWDAKGKCLDVPVFELLGGKLLASIQVYASGGDCTIPGMMEKELALCRELGIEVLKIRSNNNEIFKTNWTLNAAKNYQVDIAVDMCQNLAVPSQTVTDVLDYIYAVADVPRKEFFFLEEVLGPQALWQYRELRSKTDIRFTGGETLTATEDFLPIIKDGYFDAVQPDASVVGGISQVFDICKFSNAFGIETIVHNWGSSVALMANYHAAFAAGCIMAEWPIKTNPLRDDLFVKKPILKGGRVTLPDSPGLGVELTNSIREKYPFDNRGTYICPGDFTIIPDDNTWDI